MSHIPSSPATPKPFAYSDLPADMKVELMKLSSLKQLDQGLARVDRTSHQLALQLVRGIAEKVIRAADPNEEVYKKLNQLLTEKASDSIVHTAFIEVITTCKLEDIPLMDVASHIQGAAQCGISAREHHEILSALKSTTTSYSDVIKTISSIAVDDPDSTQIINHLLTERSLALAFVHKFPSYYKKLSPALKADKQIILEVLKSDASACANATIL